MGEKMSKQEAKETIEQISKKYFYTEVCELWMIHDDSDPPFWNIFTIKAFTPEDCRKLGEALIELAGEIK